MSPYDDMTAQQRYELFRDALQSIVVMTKAISPDLVAAIKYDADQWELLAPILDPTAYRYDLRSYHRDVGQAVLDAFIPWHRVIHAIEDPTGGR